MLPSDAVSNSNCRPVPADCALATCAHASYGQMRLDGIELFLAFLLMVFYGFVVDLALIIRIFRHRAAMLGGIIGFWFGSRNGKK